MDKLLLFEVKRKLAHVLLTFWPLLFVLFGFSKAVDLVLYLTYLTFMLSSEFIRIRYNYNTPTAMLIKSFSRSTLNDRLKDEWNRIRIPYWIFGGLFAMALFGSQVVVASTVCLVFGDSASGVTKALLRKRKSFAGTGIGIVVSVLLIYAFTGNTAVAVLSSVIGMIGDTNDLVNDNLSIPLLAAIGAYVGSLV